MFVIPYGHFFLGSMKLQKIIMNTEPDMSKILFVSDRGGNCPCTYRAFFRFHRLVALFQLSKYKNSIFDHFSATKMAPPGGDIEFVFGRSSSKFPTLSHAKKKFLHIFIQKKVAKSFMEPKKSDL